MFYATLIFKQLEHANELAQSHLLQENRLSLILLDNLIELILKSHAETRFGFDRPTWLDGFKQEYSPPKRAEIISYFDKLLAFSVKAKLISDSEKTVLKFTHAVRNKTYHQNRHNETLMSASISLNMHLIRNNLAQWKTGHSLYNISSEDNLYFENAFDIGKTEAWQQIALKLTTYLEKSKIKSNQLLIDELLDRINRIEKNLKFLYEDLKGIDLNDMNMFNDFPFNQVKIPKLKKAHRGKKRFFLIQLSLFCYENKNRYKDSTDTSEIKSLLKKFAAYMKEKDPRLSVKLDSIKRRIERIKTEPDGKMIEIYEDCYSKIRPLYKASEEAARALDGYIMHLTDVARGK